MTMRRYVLIATALACAAGSLTACGGSDEPASVPSASVTTSTGAQPSQASSSSPSSPSSFDSSAASSRQSAAGAAVVAKAREAGPLKEVGSFAAHIPSLSNQLFTFHIASVTAGKTGTVMRFWVTSPSTSRGLAPSVPEMYPSLVAGSTKYSVNAFQMNSTEIEVAGSEGGEIDGTTHYVMEGSYPVLPSSVTKVKATVGDKNPSAEIPVTR